MKRFIKAVSIMIALVLLLPVLALGCTDKDEPRKLDGIEESIVGKWKSDVSNQILTFTDKGTVLEGEKLVDTFEHDGSGIEDGENGRGHYEIIVTSHEGRGREEYYLFDSDPDTLYFNGLASRAWRRVIDEE